MVATLLEVQHVTKRFGGFQALTEVSLQVHQGECLGLIGPNGSGKTTLINCIAGVLRTSIHLKRDTLWYQPLNAIG
jgi:branched-chain amino acid transport system ATP-binding protein